MQMGLLGIVADHVLQTLRLMTHIMTSTCFCHDEGEIAFDRHLPTFVAIVNHSTALVKFRPHNRLVSHTSASHA